MSVTIAGTKRFLALNGTSITGTSLDISGTVTAGNIELAAGGAIRPSTNNSTITFRSADHGSSEWVEIGSDLFEVNMNGQSTFYITPTGITLNGVNGNVDTMIKFDDGDSALHVDAASHFTRMSGPVVISPYGSTLATPQGTGYGVVTDLNSALQLAGSLYASGDITGSGHISAAGTVTATNLVIGSTATTAIGKSYLALGNVSVASYTRINADESVSLLSASQMLSALGGGTGTSNLVIGTTSTTAMAGNTSIPSISGLATTTYVNGLASNYATAAQGTKADTAHGWGDHSSGGYGTSNLAIGTTSTTAMAGDTAVFKDDDVVMNENPFGGRSLYNSQANNPWFLAADRYTVTQTGGSSIANAFNGDYESSYLVAANGTATFNIDFGQHPGYPYGWIYLSFYYTHQPSAISGRVYNNYAPHTVGWSALTFTDVVNTSGQRIVKARQGKYGLTDLEITLTAPAGTTVRLTACEIHLDRPGTQEMPVLNKFRAETLYKGLTVNSTITSTGKIQGAELEGTSLDINGAADVSGNLNVTGNITNATWAGDVIPEAKLQNQSGTNTGDQTLPTLSSLGAAASSHTHTYSSITSKPTTFAPTIGTTSTTAMAGNTSIPSISGLASTSYVDSAVANLIDSAPANLNTLNELAEALNDDDDAIVTINNTLATKVSLTGNQTIAGEKTFSGDLTISQTDATAPGVMLNLHNVSNGVGTTIRCTDVSAGTSQFGDITYRHQDSKAYGSAAMFELGSTELTTTILANGKLMYNEGIYSKPASGTGAGTRKDANWDTAYGWGDHGLSAQDKTDIGNLSGENTGDQTLPTLSSLGAAASSHTHTFASLTSKPTTIAGYGITNALAIGTTSTTALAGNTTIPAAESYTEHENISAATSVNGTGRAYIQDITVDSNGHVTGIATATETVTDTNTQNDAATTRGFFSGTGVNTSTGVITNTTYTVGNGGLTQNNLTNALKTSYDGAVTHAATSHAPSNATANSSNATLLARGNHTGTQAYSTITGTPTTITAGQASAIQTNSGKVSMALNNTTTSTSTTLAGTANVVRIAYNRGSAGITAAATAQDLAETNASDITSVTSTADTAITRATNALPKAGGAMTGAITTNSTFDGVDIATRDGVLTSTTTTANAAMPKAGGAFTGAVTTNSTIDGVDIATRDGILSGTTITANAASQMANAALSKAGGTMTGNITMGSNRIIGMPIVLVAASGYINRTAAQFATDGNNVVYVGSNNYGWNDARDWATQFVSVSTPTLNQNDQMNGIICPYNLSQVTIHAQVRTNSANATMQCQVYKMNRASGVSTTQLGLTSIASATGVSTMNGRFTTIDIVGTTAVTAGQLILVGFGKTDSGNGQKPRFNFTLSGTIA